MKHNMYSLPMVMAQKEGDEKGSPHRSLHQSTITSPKFVGSHISPVPGSQQTAPPPLGDRLLEELGWKRYPVVS